MRFHKVHGLGNDFLLVDLRAVGPALDPQEPAIVRALCDRRFGVGGDGVLAVLPPASRDAAARMRVLNADGSEAEMCGNGIRCVAKHLAEGDAALAGATEVIIDTGAGPLCCRLHVERGHVAEVTVDMGAPRLARADIPMTGPAKERCVDAPVVLAGRELAVTAVSLGNPHAVSFVAEGGEALVATARRLGPVLETHSWFPRKTNAEFARLIGPAEIELVVWERGVGITLACGTGACATAVAACVTGRSRPDNEITVHLPGGDLAICVAGDYRRVLMRGPATHVYQGEVELAALLASHPG